MTNPAGLFAVRLESGSVETSGEIYAKGRMRIGDFHETFAAPLSYWTREQYERQWKEAVERVCLLGKDAALITSMRDPISANFIFWWILYREGDHVHVQNHVLFLCETDRTFAEADPYSSICEREVCNDEGVKLSEWTVELDHLRLWLASTTNGLASSLPNN